MMFDSTSLTARDLEIAYLETIRRGGKQKGFVPPDTPWTAPNVERLKTLWAEGKSAAVIGRILGVSRNAVIGKIYRMRLAQRVTTLCVIPRSYSPENLPVRKPAAPKQPKPAKRTKPTPIPYDATHVIPFLEVGIRQCRWIVDGEKSSAMACGAPTEEKHSYCGWHNKLAWSGNFGQNSKRSFASKKLTGISFRHLVGRAG